jgi:hypothetical protein
MQETRLRPFHSFNLSGVSAHGYDLTGDRVGPFDVRPSELRSGFSLLHVLYI